MTGAALLARAHAAGAILTAANGRVVVDGASRLLPELLVALRAHKSEVLAALQAAKDCAPTAPCLRCGTGAWWRTSTFPTGADAGSWRCSTCTPPPADAWIDACHMPAAHVSPFRLSPGVSRNAPAEPDKT